ncbi:transporter associated domain-containing protein [Nitratireductor mangrovi]|uniref:transporter associated domain-containing protein n=1 Tax=Nitratireductor mangrovi TaxID=2599600 RepID=UPI00197EA5C8|nr:transporter associated domain-containing protein [Nitratireductor mangrovi]
MYVLEAIAGELPEHGTDEPKVVTRADGSYLIAGWMPVDGFADLLSLEIDEDREYETVAGPVLDEAGQLLEVGQRIDLQGWGSRWSIWTVGASTSFWCRRRRLEPAAAIRDLGPDRPDIDEVADEQDCALPSRDPEPGPGKGDQR